MAKCKKCNAEIPAGQELCSKCEKENSESYLDDLLHSITNEGRKKEKPAAPQEISKSLEAGDMIQEEYSEKETGAAEEAGMFPDIPADLFENEAFADVESTQAFPELPIEGLEEEPFPEISADMMDMEETLKSMADTESTQAFPELPIEGLEGEPFPEISADMMDMEETLKSMADTESTQAFPELPIEGLEEEPFPEISADMTDAEETQENMADSAAQKDTGRDFAAVEAAAGSEPFPESPDSTEYKDEPDELSGEFDALFDGEAMSSPPEEGEGSYNIFEDDEAETLDFDQMLQGLEEDSRQARTKDIRKDAMAFENEPLPEESVPVRSGEQEAPPALEHEDEALGEMNFDASDAEKPIPEEDPAAGLAELLSLGAENMENDILSIPDSLDVGEEPAPADGDGLQKDGLAAMAEEKPTEEKTDDDILDLINSLYNSDYEEGEESSAQSGGEDSVFGDEQKHADSPEDIEDVFSDTLSVINSLNDAEEEGGQDAAGDAEVEKAAKKEKKAKAKKEKKPGLFKRIFGNIKTERSEEEIAELKEKVIADAEAKAAAEEEKAKEAAAKKEEKKKKAAEAKSEAAKKKQDKAKQKAETAKQKKEEKDKKKQEIQNLIDAIDEDEGRINRVGAAVVFIFFAAVAAVIIIGTRNSNYAKTMANAEDYFENRHYNEAYDEVAGIDKVKKEDQTFVLQVTTVMIAYKQLNSFRNFYEMELYPEALDSLIKGLERYDEFSGIGAIIEVDRDLDYVRAQLNEKLEEVFGLTERDARALMEIEDREEYTTRIYEIAESRREEATEN